MIHWAKLGSLEAHSRDHEETRYLATTVIVSCSRCNFHEAGSPMWTKWVLHYLKHCYSCILRKHWGTKRCWTHIVFVHFRQKKKRKKEAAGELQGLRENIMSSSGFLWYHIDSSIKLHSVSLSTLSHSVINVIINQTTPHSPLINLISSWKF